jgi:hypothetical protein
MNKQITITNLVGTEPYNVYLCDSSFGGCIYITTINDVNVPYSFLVPISYLIFTTVGVKIIDSQGCVITGLVNI